LSRRFCSEFDSHKRANSQSRLMDDRATSAHHEGTPLADLTLEMSVPISPDSSASSPSSFELFTLIGEDVELLCGIDTAGPVLIQGKVGGDIHCPAIEVDHLAQIAGGIEAKNVTIFGHVQGSVHSWNVILESSAQVDGEVIADEVRAAPGAFVRGRMYPPRELTPSLLRELLRIARRLLPVDEIDQSCLQVLHTDRLCVVCDGMVFVSIYGLLALDRQCSENAGLISRVLNGVQGKLRPEATFIGSGVAYKSPAVPLTVLAQDLTLASSIFTQGDIHINGDVQGNIQSRNCLVGHESHIEGSITARKVVIDGHVTGSITSDSVVLNATACVEGTVNFGTIASHSSACYNTGTQIIESSSRPENSVRIRDSASAIEACLANMTAAA